jgi:hypothetical protein
MEENSSRVDVIGKHNINIYNGKEHISKIKEYFLKH